MKPEELEELSELYTYKEFAELFLDIFELDYDSNTQILTLHIDNKNVLDIKDIPIVVIRDEADIIYKMASNLERNVKE